MKKGKIFTRTIQVRFHEADPAGIMYFANIFSLAHDTFEEFLPHAGIAWSEWFRKGPYFVPIRHTDCDFLAPFLPGKTYQVKTDISRIGESSFQMRYTFCSQQKNKFTTHAVVKMVHAFVSAKTHKKIKIPAKYEKILKVYVSEE